MHSLTLGTGGYTLLFSSLIALVLLVKKEFNRRTYNPFFILSVSDVICSIFTAGILLANHIETITGGKYSTENNTLALYNLYWNKEKNNWTAFGESAREYNVVDQSYSNATAPCNITHIIMQYAMLFVPLTNSFVSLLIFSLQCNLNLSCLKCQCVEFLQRCTEKDAYKNDDQVDKVRSCLGEKNSAAISSGPKRDVKEFCSEAGSMEEGNTSAAEERRSDKINLVRRVGLGSKSNDKKVLGIFLGSQWILPILVTGILYLADCNNMNYVRNLESVECVFESNFLSDNCYDRMEASDMTDGAHSVTHAISHNNYIGNEDLAKVSNPNDSQVNDIISKVQSIVNSALNDTLDVSQKSPTNFYNTSKLLDVTKFMETEVDTTVEKCNDTVIDSKLDSIGQRTTIEYKETYDSVTSAYDNQDLLHTENITDKYDAELLLFNNLVRKTFQEISSQSNNFSSSQVVEFIEEGVGDTDISSTEETSTQEVTETSTIRSTTIYSNDQIYADIIKRIHGISLPNGLRNQLKFQQYYSRKQPKQTNLEQNFQNNSQVPTSTYSVIKINATTSTCMDNRCFLSPRFMKLHLLVFIFLVYFLPILICSILYTRGKLSCHFILNDLKSNVETETNDHVKDKGSNANFDIVIGSNEACASSKWITEYDRNFSESSKESSNSLQEIPAIEGLYNNEVKKVDREYEKSIEPIKNQGLTYSDIVQRTENMQKLFRTIKKSLLCGTLLWTPVFFQVLLKTFLCTPVPDWLMNITFLCAIAFGIVRNIFNVGMIKLQDTSGNIAKTNSVRPIE